MAGEPSGQVPVAGGRDRDYAYLLPRHPSEIDRLDVQHYALREALLGNYLVPIAGPGRILDVGSGTGQWAYELCAEYPDAQVVGMDVERSKPLAPRNYGFVRANVLLGLPFAGDTFDFVHQRLMVSSSIPMATWPSVSADLARVTRPGGWVELVEGLPGIGDGGPATERLLSLGRQLMRSAGLDVEGALVRALGEQLERDGLRRVEQRTVDLPIGEWGGRVGSLTATNLRSLLTRMAGTFETELGISRNEFGELVRDMQEEWDSHHSTITFVCAFGQKPGGG